MRNLLLSLVPFLLMCLILLSCQGMTTGEADNEFVQNRGAGMDDWFSQPPSPSWKQFKKAPQGQAWFEVYRIRPGIFAIHEPGHFELVISYLIVGTQRSLLFDTGLGIGDMKGVISELTDHDPIVLNSHTHYDHVGGNHSFRTIYGATTEFTRTNARGKSHDEVAEFVSEGWIRRRTPKGFSSDTYRIEPFSVGRTVADGDQIDLGDRTLEVLLTPGHTPDSLCLLDRANRLLFTGDTFYPEALYAHFEGADVGQYTDSARRLAGLADQIDWLLPAHMEPWLTSQYLVRMRDAFEVIQEGSASFILTDGNRQYSFEGFSIIIPDTPGDNVSLH